MSPYLVFSVFTSDYEAVGNMISMKKGLERGKSASDLVVKQFIGGVLLFVFAYFIEGLTGHHS
jgi:hypothetical protein